MHSYRKSHVKHKIEKLRKTKSKKSVFKKIWFWLVILFAIALATAIYFVFFYAGLWVKNITVSGNSKISSDQLQSVISSNATTGLVNFLGLQITSKSILLVSTRKINAEILKKFPIIEGAKIDKIFPQTLTIGVVERTPAGIYCKADNGCFLIDANGIIYQPSDLLQSNYFIVRQTVEDPNLYTGESAVAQNIIPAILKIQKDLQDNFKITITQALIASDSRVNLTTGDGWQIYVNTKDTPDINSQITKLNLLLSGDITPAVRKTLQYIDLRFEDRAYYK